MGYYEACTIINGKSGRISINFSSKKDKLMRLGLVEKGSYINKDYPDLTGYKLEVNGYLYDFGQILSETRRRVELLWQIECPPDLLRHRLHFSEQRYFNRMVRNDHYGIFNRHTGAHVCLGLVDEAATINLVIHELAHEMHSRQGYYELSDEYVQEGLAIMTEQEFGRRSFDFNPHFTAQQMIDQLLELPDFGSLPFLTRWEILSKVGGIVQLSYLINRYTDDHAGGYLRGWLDHHCASPDEARHLANALAQTSQFYALYNRRLLLRRFVELGGAGYLNPSQVHSIVRALLQLRELDKRYPDQSLSDLMEQAFSSLN